MVKLMEYLERSNCDEEILPQINKTSFSLKTDLDKREYKYVCVYHEVLSKTPKTNHLNINKDIKKGENTSVYAFSEEIVALWLHSNFLIY